MKRVAVAGLSGICVVWGLAGCNQIFGLDPTEQQPPEAGIDAGLRYAQLSYQVARVTPDGAQVEELELVPVSPTPVVRIGLLDQALMVASYSDRQIEYPYELVGQPWRVEFTPPGGTPHEVQWRPADGQGHLVVPIFGPVARTSLPPGTGYRITTATNETWHGTSDASPNRTVIYTTGYWTRTPLTGGSTTTLDLDFGAIPPLSGVPGGLVAGDVVAAIDYAPAASCRSAALIASFTAVPFLDGMLAPTTSPIHESFGTTADFTYPPGDPAQFRIALEARLAAALGTRSNPIGTAHRIFYGKAAHAGMPGFTHTLNNLPAPLFVPFADCPLGTARTELFTLAPELASFKDLAFAYVVNQRSVSGVSLPSSIASVGTAATGQPLPTNFDVPIAQAPIRLGPYDLAEGSEPQVIDNTRVRLTFELDKPAVAPFALDYYEVVLYQLGTTQAVPVRTYVGVELPATITFDPSVMEADTDHVFAIRTFRGRPQAKAFDFSVTDYPQVMATVYTRSFRRL